VSGELEGKVAIVSGAAHRDRQGSDFRRAARRAALRIGAARGRFRGRSAEAR
jgi:hypothetical protein